MSFEFKDYVKLIQQLTSNATKLEITDSSGFDNINNENATEYLHKLIAPPQKLTEINNDIENVTPRVPSNTCRGLSLTWLKQEELTTNMDDVIMLQFQSIDKYCTFFDIIRIQVTQMENPEKATSFEEFCKKFTTSLSELFAEMEYQGKTLNMFGSINASDIFDWMMIYYSCYWKNDIFQILLTSSDFIRQSNCIMLLFRETNNHGNTIINKVCSTPELFSQFMTVFGRTETWNILLEGNTNFPESRILNNIFNNKDSLQILLPNVEDNDFEIIKNLLLNYRDSNNSNIMHYVFGNFVIANDNQQFLCMISNKIPYLKHLRHECNNNNQYPYHYVSKCINNFHNLVNANLIDCGDILRYDFTYGPLIQYLLNNISDENLTTLIDNNLEGMLFSLIYSDMSEYNNPNLLNNNEYLDKVFNKIIAKLNKLIDNSDHPIDVLLKRVSHVGSIEKYPLVAYLSYFFVNEFILSHKNMPSNTKLYNVLTECISMYPWLLPFKILDPICSEYDISNYAFVTPILCTNTILHTVSINGPKYAILYLESILKSYRIHDFMCTDSNVKFLISIIESCADHPDKNGHNYVLPFFASLCEYQTVTEIPASLTNHTIHTLINYPDFFESALDNINTLFIIKHSILANSPYLSDMIYKCMNVLYNHDKIRFVDRMNLLNLWPIHLVQTNHTDMNILCTTILKDPTCKFSYAVIFGDNVQNMLEYYMTNQAYRPIFKLYIENGHLDKWYDDNYKSVSEMLNKLRPLKLDILKLLLQIPKMELKIYDTDGDDIFSYMYQHVLKQDDSTYYYECISWILNKYEPSEEYKIKLIKNINICERCSTVATNMKYLFLHGFITQRTLGYNEYVNTLVSLICENNTFIESLLDEYLKNTHIDKLLEFLDVDDYILSPILIALVGSSSIHKKYILDVLSIKEIQNHIAKFDEQFVIGIVSKITPENATGYCGYEILEKLFLSKLIHQNTLVLIFDTILTFEAQYCEPIFCNVLNDYNIISMLQENKNIVTNFITKSIENNKNLVFFAKYLVQCENYNELVSYFNNIDEIINKLKDNRDYQNIYFELSLKHNVNITDEMVKNLLLFDNQNTNDLIKKYVKKCIANKTTINNLSLITSKIPDIILLLDNAEDHIQHLNLECLIKLVKSNLITPNLQDCILNHLSENTNDIQKILEHITISSSFIETNVQQIFKMMKLNDNIFENFIVNNISIDKYCDAVDEDDDYLIAFVPHWKLPNDTVKMFINNLASCDFYKKNNRGHYKILHLLMPQFLEHLLKRSDVISLLGESTHIGKAIFKLFIEQFIKNNKYDQLMLLPENIISTVDKTNKNIYMLLLRSRDDFSSLIIETLKTFDKEKLSNILHHKDADGNTLLFYFTKYPNVIDDVINLYIEIFGNTCLRESNDQYETLLMYAIRYNPLTLSTLLKNEFIGSEQNYVYINNGSILSHHLLYINDETEFENLLRWKHLSKNYLEISAQIELYDWLSGDDPIHCKTNVYTPVLALCALKNSTIFKNLLSTDVDKLINCIKLNIGKFSYSFVETIFVYNPESFHYLIGHENFSKIQYNDAFFATYYYLQPASWYFFVTSSLPKHEYTDIPSILESSHIHGIAHYIQTTNEPATTKHDKCTICTIGKNKILFGCHKHMTCVQCAYKTHTCPYCRNTNSNDKLKILD